MRRSEAAAQRAAQQASEAARVLQARGQEKVAEKAPESAPEPVVRKDPPTPEQKEQVAKLPRGNRNREEMLAHIRKDRGEPQEEEVKEVKDEKPEPAPQKEEPKEPQAEATTSQPEADIPASSKEAVVSEQPQVQTVRVKVDGEEFDAPKEEVDAYGGLRAYQIAKAQENRLQKMNDALAAIREQQNKVQTPAQPQQTDDQFIQSMIDTVRFGTPEESASALRKIMERGQQKVDPQVIVMQATLAMQKQTAARKFATDYPEIISNPILTKLALTMEAEEMQNLGKSRGPVDFGKIYDRIGQQIRGAIPRPSQAQSPAATTPSNTSQVSSDKEARKASISEPPKASAARATLPEEDKPETREQSLNRMRKARGQTAH